MSLRHPDPDDHDRGPDAGDHGPDTGDYGPDTGDYGPDAGDCGPDAATPKAVADGSLPAPETFGVVADETRQRILGALRAADDAPLQFSVLQRRASVDGSTRFNYHLQELRGTFVRETADGYALTARAAAFVDAVSAAPSLDPDAAAGRTDSD